MMNNVKTRVEEFFVMFWNSFFVIPLRAEEQETKHLLETQQYRCSLSSQRFLTTNMGWDGIFLVCPLTTWLTPEINFFLPCDMCN